MSAFSRPGVAAAVLFVTALVLHPAVRSGEWLPGRAPALAALLVLVTVALVARTLAGTGPRQIPAALLAAGVALTVGAVGVDGVQGHRGTLELVPGQARSHFDEVGPDGRALGLRPLGFTVGVERVLSDSGVSLVLPGKSEPVALTTTRAVGHEGFRLARPRTALTGGAALLRIGISGDGGSTVVDLQPGRPAEAGDLRLGVEQYYPDFELEDGLRPHTRSLEPNNPGAVLTVESPRGSFRAFVLRSMPGVHRVEEIGRAFSLLAVEPEVSVEIDVSREPFAPLALLGALLAFAGVALALRAS